MTEHKFLPFVEGKRLSQIREKCCVLVGLEVNHQNRQNKSNLFGINDLDTQVYIKIHLPKGAPTNIALAEIFQRGSLYNQSLDLQRNVQSCRSLEITTSELVRNSANNRQGFGIETLGFVGEFIFYH